MARQCRLDLMDMLMPFRLDPINRTDLFLEIPDTALCLEQTKCSSVVLWAFEDKVRQCPPVEIIEIKLRLIRGPPLPETMTRRGMTVPFLRLAARSGVVAISSIHQAG